MAAKKIALFIDADNVSSKFGKQIIDELSRRGEIFIRRIYGNWEKSILHGWNECILNFSLRAVQQTDFVAGKNATDMSLTIDAMDVLYGGRADVFALVSNDSDFTPLAIRLREGGINVLGLGNGRAANSFRMACSEFIDLDAPPVEEKFPIEQISKPVRKKSTSKENSPMQLNLFDLEKKVVELKPQTSAPEKISPPKVVTPAPKVTVPAQVQPVVKISPVTNPKVVSLSERQLQSEHDKKIQQVHNLLNEVAQIHGDEQGFTPLCWAGDTFRKKNLGFGIKDVGYSSFRMFVAAFPKLYEVIHRTNGENYCFRCLASAQISADEKIQKLHDVLLEAATVHGDEKGFVLLSTAGTVLGQKNLDLKGSGHGTLSKFLAAFPELYELKGNNGSFLYRCLASAQISADEKIRQVHDVLLEAVKMHGDYRGFVSLSWTGAFLNDKNLDVKNLGYATLQNFIEAFPELYELQKIGTIASFRFRTDAPQVSADDSKSRQLHDVLLEAVKMHGDYRGFVSLSWTGAFLNDKNLDVKNLGYATLQNFIEAFPELYELQKVGTTVSFRCRTDALQISADDSKSRQLHDILRESWALHTETDGFVNLWWTCDFIIKKNFPRELKSMSHKDLLEFVSLYPERYELRQNGTNDFSYRHRTDAPQISADEKIRQVHDVLREAVKIHGDYRGFVNLSWTGAFLNDKNLDVKNLGYATLQNFIEAFPELYELQKVGTTASFRCRTDAPQVSADDSKSRQLHDILREAWALHTGTDGFVNLWCTRDFIVKKIYSRELKPMSYKDLLEFVSLYPERYELRQNGTNDFSYRYRTDAPKISADDSRLCQLHDILRESAKVHADAEGFSLPVQAGQYIRDKNLNFSVKDFGYATVREFVSAFPELYETAQDDTGAKFRYRPRQKFLSE